MKDRSLCSRAITVSAGYSVPNSFSLLLACLALFCVILLAIPNLLSLNYTIDHNYNEGWNVYNTQRLLNHELIYDNNYWRVNNYPIGSFIIVAIVNFFLDNLLLSGRVVALTSFAGIGVLAAIASRSFGGDRIDAVFGSACTLGFCYLVAPSWIMVDDPQSLGEAVMLAALVTYVSDSPDRRRLSLAALLVVSGGFIKHNLVAIPLAITLDLAARCPRRLLFWLAGCAGLAAGFLGLTELVAGGTFIDHLLSPRIFTWSGARYHFMKYLRLFKFPLAVVVLFSQSVFSNKHAVLAAWGVISIVSATMFAGFEGASYNMFQDGAVFLGIGAGIVFRELRRRTSGRYTGTVFAFVSLLLIQPILTRSPEAFAQIYRSRALLEFNRKAEEEFLADVEYISEKSGPAICESLLLCYNARQPFILDPFNSRQYILAGRLEESELIRRISAGEFAVIQVRADICDDRTTSTCHILHYPQKVDRFTDNTLYAIDRYYRVARRSQDGTFYVPW
jgi:hypothetical protein